MIGQSIEDVRRRQTVAGNLSRKSSLTPRAPFMIDATRSAATDEKSNALAGEKFNRTSD
jgi:hypothetical protein